MASVGSPKPCCSGGCRAESIVGTAPHEEAYLIVELAKPWGKKIKSAIGAEPFKAVLKHAKEDVKLLGTPRLDWLPLCQQPWALLVRRHHDQTVITELEADPEAIRAALQKPPEGKPLSLYLVCTHGTRDRCCGTLGYPIYKTLQDHSERRVVQISHLGGHRYAPVILALPEWRFFGHATPDNCLLMDRALNDGQPYLHGHRGTGYLPKKLQPIESALWEHFGSRLASLKLLDSHGLTLTVQALLLDGPGPVFRAELGVQILTGFKNCDDMTCGQPQTFEVPTLLSLSELPLSTV